MSDNLTYKRTEKTFEDSAGNRIKVEIAHGAIYESRGDYLPTTWVHISLLPQAEQSVADFAATIGFTDQYQAIARENGAKKIDDEIRKDGVEIGTYNSFIPDAGNIFYFNEVGKLFGKIAPFIGQDTVSQISDYLTREANSEKRLEAQEAYKRTGGRGSKQIVSM